MPRIQTLHFMMPLLMMSLLVSLWGCGIGYTDGWREDEVMSKQERCNRIDGRQWTGNACVTDSEFQLAQSSKAQCDQRFDTTWFQDTCRLIKSLDANSCNQAPGLVWNDFVCVSQAQHTCEENPAKVYVDGTCKDRALAPK